MSDFKEIKKKLIRKQKLYSSLTYRKINDKENDHFLNVWKKFEIKTRKDNHIFYLKCDVLLLGNA